MMVVGASRWLPQFGFGVATQIDAAEGHRLLRGLPLVWASFTACWRKVAS